ncbi:hypothetical protein ACHAXT_000205 [Thalassiosira profunda]
MPNALEGADLTVNEGIAIICNAMPAHHPRPPTRSNQVAPMAAPSLHKPDMAGGGGLGMRLPPGAAAYCQEIQPPQKETQDVSTARRARTSEPRGRENEAKQPSAYRRAVDPPDAEDAVNCNNCLQSPPTARATHVLDPLEERSFESSRGTKSRGDPVDVNGHPLSVQPHTVREKRMRPPASFRVSHEHEVSELTLTGWGLEPPERHVGMPRPTATGGPPDPPEREGGRGHCENPGGRPGASGRPASRGRSQRGQGVATARPDARRVVRGPNSSRPRQSRSTTPANGRGASGKVAVGRSSTLTRGETPLPKKSRSRSRTPMRNASDVSGNEGRPSVGRSSSRVRNRSARRPSRSRSRTPMRTKGAASCQGGPSRKQRSFYQVHCNSGKRGGASTTSGSTRSSSLCRTRSRVSSSTARSTAGSVSARTLSTNGSTACCVLESDDDGSASSGTISLDMTSHCSASSGTISLDMTSVQGSGGSTDGSLRSSLRKGRFAAPAATAGSYDADGSDSSIDSASPEPSVAFDRSRGHYLRTADLGLTEDTVHAAQFLDDLNDLPEPHFHHPTAHPPPGVPFDTDESWICVDDGNGGHSPIAPQVVDALVSMAYRATFDRIMWTPTAKTRKYMAEKRLAFDSVPMPGPTFEGEGGSSDKHCLLWMGKFPRSHHGADRPAVRSQAIVNLTAEALVDLLMDSGRVEEYDRTSMGRMDEVVLSYGHGHDEECPFSGQNKKKRLSGVVVHGSKIVDGSAVEVDEENVLEDDQTSSSSPRRVSDFVGVTKIVRSYHRLPWTSKMLEFNTLMHCRELVEEQGDNGYIVVSRSVVSAKSTDEEKDVVRSEVMLNVHIIRRLHQCDEAHSMSVSDSGREATRSDLSKRCLLISMSHVKSPLIPKLLAKKIGTKSAKQLSAQNKYVNKAATATKAVGSFPVMLVLRTKFMSISCTIHTVIIGFMASYTSFPSKM